MDQIEEYIPSSVDASDSSEVIAWIVELVEKYGRQAETSDSSNMSFELDEYMDSNDDDESIY